MLKRRLTAAWILSALLLASAFSSAWASELVVYSLQPPGKFVLSQDRQNQGWQNYYAPPRYLNHIQLSNRGKLLFEMSDANGSSEWHELDVTPSQTLSQTPPQARLIARESSFKQGFLELMPIQRSDGSYYAKLIQPYGIQIYLVSSGGQKLFLNKANLYDFQPLSDGSYVYVISNLRGNESNDFADFIPGRKMQLWHQPLKGKARLLGQFDTVLNLRSSGQEVLFFTPGKTQGAKSWNLLSCTSQGQVTLLAEIPKTASRGTPDLISWFHSDWIVYPAAMVADGQPQEWIRHNLKTGAKAPLDLQAARLLAKGQGQAGYLTGIQYGPEGSSSHSLLTFSLQTGEVVQRLSYRWREVAPDWALYLP